MSGQINTRKLGRRTGNVLYNRGVVLSSPVLLGLDLYPLCPALPCPFRMLWSLLRSASLINSSALFCSLSDVFSSVLFCALFVLLLGWGAGCCCQRPLVLGRLLMTLTPQSHQTFRPVPTVNLLGIMFKNRCWPSTSHTVKAEDADRWWLNSPVWSTPQGEGGWARFYVARFLQWTCTWLVCSLVRIKAQTS